MESKSVCIKQQGKTHIITAEELKKKIAEDEAYFVHNGRILKIGEVSGLRHNVHWQETRVTHLSSASVDVQETVRTLPWQRRNRGPHQTHVREWIGFSSGSILGMHVGNIIQPVTTLRRQRRDMFICNHAESDIDPSICDTTDYVPTNIPDEPQSTRLYILEDTSSVIQMSSKGRAPTLLAGWEGEYSNAFGLVKKWKTCSPRVHSRRYNNSHWCSCGTFTNPKMSVWSETLLSNQCLELLSLCTNRRLKR